MTRRHLAACLAALLPQGAAADCFDAPLFISRYFLTDPGAPGSSWQDLYAWTPGQPAVRLSTGAFPGVARDHTSPVALPGGEVLFQHSAGGGTDVTIARMEAADADGDMRGDGWADLASGGLEPSAMALRAGRVVTTVLDAAGEAQVGVASLSGGVLSPFVPVTADAAFPDGYTFLTDDIVLHDVDGDGLSLIDLASGAAAALATGLPLTRTPTAPEDGSFVVFAALNGASLDLYRAEVLAGPALGPPAVIVDTPDLSETAPRLSPDGACLLWLAAPPTDGTGAPVRGPYADLYIRDLATGETRRMSVSRDLGAADWARP